MNNYPYIPVGTNCPWDEPDWATIFEQFDEEWMIALRDALGEDYPERFPVRIPSNKSLDTMRDSSGNYIIEDMNAVALENDLWGYEEYRNHRAEDGEPYYIGQ